MKPKRECPWELTPQEAVKLQEEWRREVKVEDGPRPGDLRLVAGCDVSFSQARGMLYAAVVVLKVPGFEVAEESTACLPATFPYIPGLLAFREIPALLSALEKIKSTPDLVLCDGQGIAHPRGMGIASHLGVLFDLPTVGVAKTCLVGKWEAPGSERGSFSYLRYRGRVVGTVLRTRTGVKPVFVSPGHMVSVDLARELALYLAPRYRLPEPLRLAHLLSYRLNRQS
ncbi:deoxyribonuclease V [Desulfothermobacter acidiphilus]|uniref:deoxyribonuclease V n=1 Tax=Desulfothermobacter acidiphilus TaxID=1938353 RepID=UPI003F8CCCC4